jgi:signal transduction histidine kinase
MRAARSVRRPALTARGEGCADQMAAPGKATHRQSALLMVGFSASVLLVLISAAFSAAQVSRGREEFMHLLRKSERNTYLIGHVGVQLSRMRLLLRDVAAHGQSPAAVLSVLDTNLRSSLAELEPLLSSQELRLWRDLKPQILEHRAHLLEAASSLNAGEAERAASVMDGLVAKSSEIMNDLAQLNGLNRLNAEAAFRHADQRLRLMMLTGVAASFALVAGIAATWWIVLRLVRRQRADLDAYVQRVELANADLNAFAGRIAHDLRNVLSPVLLAVATLELHPADASRLVAITERIKRMASRALALLDALLTFSKAGQASASDDVCSVEAELRAVVEELAPAAERIGAGVEVTMAAPMDAQIACSAGLFGIVLRNVIGNAVKFVDGAPRRRVRVEVRSAGQQWCDVLVEDSGPGIPQESLPRIFDPFYRVPGTKAPGTGIGLATVQRIVQAHRGRVIVDSARGEGTRVELRFPLARTSADGAARRKSGDGSAPRATTESQLRSE